ncbi:hypothetical protein [Rathayibacter sp. VKM Ac-2630]|uniref:hypothetical protein n=1 Tax=Rathayibacter sp. VKM Ac-2630 TaxID=1938617 RepID=UPI0009C55030|nr:hypothetical protein [Rathayibacter sp. VKM Ac-2630]OOB90733.1 hypothetical protein B0T42_10010 [Rathayibacter sp. VKM Ac-2630]
MAEQQEVRVLTVRQPWAWAIIYQGKDVENRSRSLGPYRGTVAIHAGLRDDPAGYYDGTRDNLPHEQVARGAIIGLVDLVDVVTDSTSPWAWEGAHHLLLANPRPLATPIPYRGGLGIRRLPADVAAAVLRAASPLQVSSTVSRTTRRGGKYQSETVWGGEVVALLARKARVRWTSKNGLRTSPFVSDHYPHELEGGPAGEPRGPVDPRSREARGA